MIGCTHDDLVQAVLDCASADLKARLSGYENGFDDLNTLVLFGRAKAMALELIDNAQDEGRSPSDPLVGSEGE